MAAALRFLQARPARAAWTCALLALALALPGIGDLDGLGHPDEAFYLSIVSDMADTGHLMPTHGGGYVFQKPPLVFWAARLSFALFGRNAAAATCGAGAIFAAEIAGEEAALLGGLLLLGCLGVARFGRELMIDLPLCGLLTAAMAALARALRADSAEAARRALFWAGCFAGLSLGIKGPIGPTLLLLAGLAALALLRRLDVLGRPALWTGIAASLPAVAPWYVWAAATHLREFWAIHVVDQHFRRFATTNGQNRWNLLLGAALYAAPFTLPAAEGLARAFASRAKLRAAAFPLAWLAAFALLFGLPVEHGLHYPVLVLPPLAALAAQALAAPGRWTRPLRAVTSAACAVAGLAVALAARFPEVPAAAATLACVALVLASVLWARRAPIDAGLGSLATAVGSALVIGAIGPALGGPLLPAAAAEAGAGRRIGVLGEHPGPYALAGGWTGGYELWGAGALRGAIDRGDLVLFRDHVLDGTTAPLRARLAPLVAWRRTRPYLTPRDIAAAWRAGDLDALREDNVLCAPVAGGGRGG